MRAVPGPVRQVLSASHQSFRPSVLCLGKGRTARGAEDFRAGGLGTGEGAAADLCHQWLKRV
jgi:hypothetical protein